MCGIVGYLDLSSAHAAEREVLVSMADVITHRGPDASGYFISGSTGLGFRRLAIIDLEGGAQPILNEDESVALICNGEIYNYRELRHDLQQRGHLFRTNCDVEVLLHLYEEEGVGFLNRLNGQFAFAIYDRNNHQLFIARDHFGINPLFYTVAGDTFIFGSEIKSLLEHPLVTREVDLTGLDQVFSFPGLVSPRTMFKGIQSLKGGHYIVVKNGDVSVREYWDLDYPKNGEAIYDKPESYYIEHLTELFERAVRYRLQADVPVGFYLSGGLDSSLIAAMINRVSPDSRRHSFSIAFNDGAISEAEHQRLMARFVNSEHHEIVYDWSEISGRLRSMIYHAECPVKESYNTCSMSLSEAAKSAGITVILTGEGADELFAGYVGYRFDELGLRRQSGYGLEEVLEQELRERLWGDKSFFYEIDQHSFRDVKTALYSSDVNELYDDFDCLKFAVVNTEKLRDRHDIHRRSYLDVKLRLSDHLISDHGDRMALSNSVEARYPFLDIDLVEFSTRIPPELKLNKLSEKYILKKVAGKLVPSSIVNREKFGFHAPGSPYLLHRHIEWILDMLSYERIRRQGYFNPDTIEILKKQYMQEGFSLNLPFESDLLMIVLTFNTFLETFNLPDMG